MQKLNNSINQKSMKNIGKFQINSLNKETLIPLDQLKPGFNSTLNHIVEVNSNKEVVKVIDKVCDHAGGKLILNGQEAVCPMHNWRLCLNTLNYSDSHISKKVIPFKIIDNNLVVPDSNKNLINPFIDYNSKSETKIRWLNHASVYFEVNGISLVTDPWLFGPAFMTGWWLSDPSSLDSLDLLNKADFIYISHNHPDHLHPETLNKIGRDKKFIVANFPTRSTEKYLNALGFNNVFPLDFNTIYELSNQFRVSILKSGDFRDDSGIYLNIGKFQFLLTVDANFLNSNVLPKDIDLLMTSFAGGASGFPLCFENYSIDEKLNILNRNKIAINSQVINYLKITNPKYYMPYAGMFSEYALRDSFILENNKKNNAEFYREVCQKLGINYLSPRKDVEFNFQNNDLTISKLELNFFDKDDTEYYINQYKQDFLYDSKTIIDYFKNSGFEDNQILYIIPTNDSFTEIVNDIVYIDFKNHIFSKITYDQIVEYKEDYKTMKLFVRQEIIACIIENKLPWEDFSIGFQMRIERTPNEYESKFWYYFTNTYINDINFRYSSLCGACTVINQNPVWNKNLSI